MRRVIALLLPLLLLVSAVTAQAQVYDDSPLKLLNSYYTAINLGEYTTAYGLRQAPQQTLSDFVSGFADTLRVEPWFGAYQPSTTPGAGRVPAVLIGYQKNGTIRTFTGCFYVASANTQTNWRITDWTLRVVSENFVLTDPGLRAYLSINCYPVPSPAPAAVQGTHAAADLVRSYFDAINDRNFIAAYALWLYPLPFPQPNGAPAQDFRPLFDQFVSGYAQTRYITVYSGAYNFSGAAAGSSYLNGFLPVVLVDQLNDGRVSAYVGCYVIGSNMGGQLGIVNGRLNLLQAAPVDGLTILNALATADCTGIPY